VDLESQVGSRIHPHPARREASVAVPPRTTSHSAAQPRSARTAKGIRQAPKLWTSTCGEIRVGDELTPPLRHARPIPPTRSG
jgi:hypothetical protein